MKPPVQGVSCEVCNKQRAAGEIHPKPSKILKGTTLLICKRCEAGGKEPRAFIIIAARTRGIDSVKDYIVNNKYEGKTIEAPEIIK